VRFWSHFSFGYGVAIYLSLAPIVRLKLRIDPMVRTYLRLVLSSLEKYDEIFGLERELKVEKHQSPGDR
jgi:hypothetical protein